MFGRATIRLGIGPHSSYKNSDVWFGRLVSQWPGNGPVLAGLGPTWGTSAQKLKMNMTQVKNYRTPYGITNGA